VKKQRDRRFFRNKPSYREARRLKRAIESRSRLDDRLSRATTTVTALPSTKVLSVSRSGLTGSFGDARRLALERLRNDEEFFRQSLASMQPLLYEYVC
jgi:hypothetical protein